MRRKFIMKSFLILGIILSAWLIFAQSCMQFRMSDSKAISQFAADGVVLQTHTEAIGGRHLHYTLTGSDTLPTIVFIHGSPGSWDAFAKYMKDKDLLQRYRMVSVDRPGFGHSDFGSALNLSQQSELMLPVLKQLYNGKPMYLAGHSLGGPLVVKLAAQEPQRFGAILILAGSVDPAMEKKEAWRPVLYKTPLKFFVPGAMRPSNEELWYLKKDLVQLKNDFSKVTCPVYILHGDKDMLVPVGNVPYAKQMLVNASKVTVTLLPGANHFIPWSHYKEIKQVLMGL
jgi:pimeloyl-ACP methyl ester carboxylesterase